MRSDKTDIIASPSSYKRLFKNSVTMYCRTFINIAISLYTSRVILVKLGVDDYGIFSVVSTISVMFSFLKAAVDSSMSRFIAIAVGKRDSNECARVFTIVRNCMLVISIIMFVALETVGVYIVKEVLSIPEDRLTAANWVFQFSTITFVIGVGLSGYNSCIVACERFSFYAGRDVITKVAMLVIVFIMAISPGDRLITYAFLYMVVSLSSTMASVVYVRCRLSRYGFSYKRGVWMHGSRDILKYAASQLLGSTAKILSNQACTIIVNIFGGLTASASWGISRQFQGSVYGFFQNIFTSAAPQIIKTYGACQIERMKAVVNNVLRLMIFLSTCVIVPLVVNMPFWLGLWLQEVPRYAITFCSISLFIDYIGYLYTPCGYVVLAEGNITKYNIVSSIISMLSIPMCLVLYKFCNMLYVVQVALITANVLQFFYTLFYLKCKSLLNMRGYVVDVLKGIFMMVVSVSVAFLIRNVVGYGEVGRVVLSSVAGWSMIVPITWFILLSRGQRNLVLDRINRVLHNKKFTHR